MYIYIFVYLYVPIQLGVGPLARVQFSLEQHRDGSTAFSMKDVGPAQRAKVQQKKTVAKGGAAERKKGKGNARDDSRLLPPVVLPQVQSIHVNLNQYSIQVKSNQVHTAYSIQVKPSLYSSSQVKSIQSSSQVGTVLNWNYYY